VIRHSILHRHQVARQRAAVPQRIEGGDSSAEQRSASTALMPSGIAASASIGASMYCWYPPS